MTNVNELKVNIKPFRISTKAKNQYRYNVKNNEDEDYETIRKKLTRNFILGELYNEDERFIWRIYGNMVIKLDKLYDIIVNVVNYKGGDHPFNINKAYKEQLEYILGLR